MRLAYVVSRFPLASETFILRELNVLEAAGAVEVELLALFAPARPFVHPVAQRWLGRVRRPGIGDGAAGLLWWLRRRPRALLHAIGELAWAHRRHPGALARALATVPIAAAHTRTIRERDVAHVHAHFATYPAMAAWLCHRLTGVSYSITAHAHDIFVDRSFLPTLVREAEFVVAISEFNRRFLAAHGGGGETPVHVVRCGIDPVAYAFRPRRPRAQGPVNALCVASLEEYKGHRHLLDALARDPRLARIELKLVGTGSLEAALRSQARELGLTARVKFLGARSELEVASLLASADLFVLPSVVARNGQMEGVPVALMEALASGVPTIATRLSGIPELVLDDVTGVLVEPADAGDLARALVALLADPDGCERRAAAGRGLIEAEYDVRRSTERLRALFAAAVAPHGVDAADPRA